MLKTEHIKVVVYNCFTYMITTQTMSGQPRRHLLQSGWSVFVSSKRLVAGDAFIFLRFKIDLVVHQFVRYTEVDVFSDN